MIIFRGTTYLDWLFQTAIPKPMPLRIAYSILFSSGSCEILYQCELALPKFNFVTLNNDTPDLYYDLRWPVSGGMV